jgi:MOSC domain-containing protein YiiM
VAGVIGERAGVVVSVNVGARRTVEWHGRQVETGIWKAPVDGRVMVRGVNLDGDEQVDRRVHGGPDKAVYAYAAEDYEWWSEELGRELGPGTFGENLTVRGVDLGAAVIGTRWRVGTTTLQVAQPRLPCFKLGMRMGDATFVEEFELAGRFGAYLRIVEEGDVGAGDAIEIEIETPPRAGITVRELGHAEHRAFPELVGRVLANPDVPETWKHWAERQQRRAQEGTDR